jgi:hypothetical protein
MWRESSNLLSRFGTNSENIGTAVREPVPAAQYVRMSTEHQRYSTENQSDAILQCAVRWGFDIVRTYADNGKSGLRLDGRDALKQLLIDVEGGSPGFKAVLVYDVSRWGRFQDADVITGIEQLGGSVARDGAKGLITINGEFTGSIVIARCLSTRGGGAMCWNLRLDTALRPDITIAMRLAPDNEQPLDYYLLPQIGHQGVAAPHRAAQCDISAPGTAQCHYATSFFSVPNKL